jgi:pSer/pThr/pTyr-binding forkhead associated (FHA) protein
VDPAPPAEGALAAEPRPEPAQPPTGGVDALAATRVVPAAGEKPPGQVVGVLVAVEGELEGTIAPVVSGENRLGRHPECEISLPSEWISRHHAKVEYRQGAFLIEASSDKPTMVNSERIEGSELHDGDYITLGKTTLRFRAI